jgi:hypothetical protein
MIAYGLSFLRDEVGRRHAAADGEVVDELPGSLRSESTWAEHEHLGPVGYAPSDLV